MSALRMFIPITKVDAAQRLVYGLATAEIEDNAGEICDYQSTKPFYEKWSQEIAKSTRGKSLGNLRAMHGPIAAGKVTSINFNDSDKQIKICAKVVDDAEWQKVAEGVYTGFSQGGAYASRWTDADGLTRYTAAPTEISLVDLPCLPQACFEMIKADGTREWRPFGKGFDNVMRLAGLIQEFDAVQNGVAQNEADESSDFTTPDKLRDLAARASTVLRAIVAEETSEVAQTTDAPQRPPKTSPTSKISTDRKAVHLTKIGAGNSGEDQSRIENLHDTSVELGAACGAQKIMPSGLEKRFDALATTLADVLQRVTRIEEQPMPLPFANNPRAIAKHEDTSADPRSGDSVEALLSDPDALSVLAIKLAHRNGRAANR